MDDKHFLIGEVADLLDMTAKTLRHYEKIGLVVPDRDTDNDYRLYSIDDVLKLRRVQRLQNLGLSLSQIKRVLEADEDDQQWKELLYALLNDIGAEIETLEARRDRVEELLDESLDEALAVELPYELETNSVKAHLGAGGDRFDALIDLIEATVRDYPDTIAPTLLPVEHLSRRLLFQPIDITFVTVSGAGLGE